ncbi:hypothetical protein JHK85_001541 [Glycine max]|nr:hypothetical protein JHK85_001541 [Glycine max]
MCKPRTNNRHDYQQHCLANIVWCRETLCRVVCAVPTSYLKDAGFSFMRFGLVCVWTLELYVAVKIV